VSADAPGTVAHNVAAQPRAASHPLGAVVDAAPVDAPEPSDLDPGVENEARTTGKHLGSSALPGRGPALGMNGEALCRAPAAYACLSAFMPRAA
jgi:hypothetical protein